MNGICLISIITISNCKNILFIWNICFTESSIAMNVLWGRNFNSMSELSKIISCRFVTACVRAISISCIQLSFSMCGNAINSIFSTFGMCITCIYKNSIFGSFGMSGISFYIVFNTFSMRAISNGAILFSFGV